MNDSLFSWILLLSFNVPPQVHNPQLTFMTKVGSFLRWKKGNSERTSSQSTAAIAFIPEEIDDRLEEKTAATNNPVNLEEWMNEWMNEWMGVNGSEITQKSVFCLDFSCVDSGLGSVWGSMALQSKTKTLFWVIWNPLCPMNVHREYKYYSTHPGIPENVSATR